MKENSENTQSQVNDEIDLIDIIKKIWGRRKIIFGSIGIFFLIGLIIAVSSPKEFKSEAVLLIETGSESNGMSGLLQQFGGIAGVTLGGKSNSDALSPDLYPDVIRSTPFLLEVLDKKITESKYDSTLTVAEYLERHTKKSLIQKIFYLPRKIVKLVTSNESRKGKEIKNRKSKNGPLILTKKELTLVSNLSSCINVQKGAGKLNNTLAISIETQDPLVSAQLTDSIIKSLQLYIVKYRTQKAKADLNFVMERHFEAQVQYLKSQQELASYRDRHKNIILASSRIQEDRLQSEYNLAFNIYNTLSQQLEQSKMKLQENTPVFSVLNPAIVPVSKSKPSTSVILLTMVFLGGVIGFLISFYKIYFNKESF